MRKFLKLPVKRYFSSQIYILVFDSSYFELELSEPEKMELVRIDEILWNVPRKESDRISGI